ncbi:MAG: NAD(P)/FAD-dependent oxidoreductase [Methylococcales bacterium]
MKYYDVIVIGAGASGLMCALTAAQRGRSVLVLEGSNKAGKKILMSGGGRCNFTNIEVDSTNYISANPHFCKSALKRYSQWDFIETVQRHDIKYEQRKHGQLFCLDSAKDILNMLLTDCAESAVVLKTHVKIKSVQVQTEGTARYQIDTETASYRCYSLVIATGALSIPKMGASGLGYQIAKQFGINVLSCRAGLVPFTFSDHFKGVAERLSGLAVEVELSCAGASFRENMLFTHRGLSGPAALQISNYWQPGTLITVNLLPDLLLVDYLLLQKSKQAKALLKTVLSAHLAKSLVSELQAIFWSEYAQTPLAEIPDKKLRFITEQLQCLKLKPAGTEGYRTAEVTLGGVDTHELNSKTMESKKQPGLFFIGEVVDVTGWLGGYNFQWAWSSAYTAGQFS